MKVPNQIESNPGYVGVHVTEEDLLRLPNIPSEEAITSSHLGHGIGIVLAYTEAWLRGVGCIPLHNAMEDAATAEISRAQIWQWRVHGVSTKDDGQLITAQRISGLVQEQVAARRKKSVSANGNKWLLAGKLVDQMLNSPGLDDFLTSVCYPHIVEANGDVETLPSKL
mmetsp:Transcript_24969/g.57371  ORF Transcript_24969/g.57371 Transcript_24969/m.57371 type:complete len:168 (+) Transcript_24969:1405-1908(+)